MEVQPAIQDGDPINEGFEVEQCTPTTPTTPNSKQRYSRFLFAFHGNKCKHCNYEAHGQAIRSNNAQRHIKSAHPAIYDSIVNGNNNEVIGIGDIKRNFVLYAATTTFPMHHVENKFLQNVFSKRNAFELMTRKTLQKMIIQENKKLKERISAILKDAKAISLSADIMTTKGMRYSYLGVVAHAWYLTGWKSFALDHIEMEEGHTAGYIRQLCERVLTEYEIPLHKIIRVVTDSAANMKAAFIKPFGPFLELEEEEDLEDLELEIADERCTRDEILNYGNIYANNLEADIPQQDVRVDFGHTHAHISCAAHRLQLVLKDVMEKDSDTLAVKKFVFLLLGKFVKSHNATRDLYLRSKKKLLFPANTRWSSLHITYERFLFLSGHINKICKEKNWPEISDADLKKISGIVELVAPFRGFTDKLQSDEIPTISRLYPGINLLIKSLEKYTGVFATVKDRLILSIKHRFKDVLMSGPNSDSTFLVAAFLDPSVSAIHQVTEEVEWLAKIETKKMCSAFAQEQMTEVAVDNTSNSLLGFTVECGIQTQRSTLQAEIDDFFQDRTRPSFRSSEAAIYWSVNKTAFPTLTLLAQQLFCIPATSASVERLFSQTTLQTTGHKSPAGPETTSAKVLLAFNKRFIV